MAGNGVSDRHDRDVRQGRTSWWLKVSDARNSKSLRKYQAEVQMLQTSITVSVPFLGQMNTFLTDFYLY